MKNSSSFSRLAGRALWVPKAAGLAFVCAAAFTSSGCYTTTNVVTMEQLRTKYPVSASGQYVDPNGAVVTEDEYTVVKPFEFDRPVKGERHDDTETTLDLQPELDRVFAQSQGDAVTDMKVYAAEYDTGSHGSAAGWKILGWTFGLTGATLLITGAAVGDDMGGTFMTVGGIFAGIGVGSYLIGLTANDPAVWKLHVTGHIVKRNASATAPAGTEPAPAEPAAAPVEPGAAPAAPAGAAPAQPAAAPAPAAPAQPAPAPANSKPKASLDYVPVRVGRG